jgi:hypothetical protein
VRGARLLLGLLLAGSLLLSSVSVLAQESPTPVPTWPPGENVVSIIEAIETRDAFGLRSDPDYVAQSLVDPLGFPHLYEGLPLTAEEHADMVHRLEVQRQLFIPSGRPDYAGAYIDQRRGGIPVFLFTEVDDEIEATLQRLMPGIEFEIHQVGVSLDELTRLKERISSAREELWQEGIELVSVSVHVVANRVEVGVIEATAEARARIAEFGEPVVVIEESLPVLDSAGAASPFAGLWEPLDPDDVSLRYYCDGMPFTLSQLASATPATAADPSLRDAIEHWGRSLLDEDVEWSIVHAGRSRVLAMAMDGDRVDSMELRRAATDGYVAETWEFERGGDCEPRTAIGRGLGYPWRLAHDYPAPGPRTRELHVIGNAGCNGTERRGKPHIRYARDAVLIAIPMGSVIHSDMCHGLGPKKMTITLPKRLGTRAMYDVGSLPIREVTIAA